MFSDGRKQWRIQNFHMFLGGGGAEKNQQGGRSIHAFVIPYILNQFFPQKAPLAMDPPIKSRLHYHIPLLNCWMFHICWFTRIRHYYVNLC